MSLVYNQPNTNEMATKKVRVGSKYVYRPNFFDTLQGNSDLKDGDNVQVVNLHGCPPANTMGMCYVKRVNVDEKFAGMVCTNSLAEA